MLAVIATAHKMAKIFYIMVRTKSEYDETKVEIDEQELLMRKIGRAKSILAELNAKLYVSAV